MYVRLLARYVDANEIEQKRIIKNIEDIMSGDVDLRSKRELIDKFITSNLPEISDSTEVENEFETFWQDEQVKEFEKICKEEGLMTDKLQNIIDKYLYTGLKPRRDDLANTLVQKPKVLERHNIIKRLASKVNKFIETFIEGV